MPKETRLTSPAMGEVNAKAEVNRRKGAKDPQIEGDFGFETGLDELYKRIAELQGKEVLSVDEAEELERLQREVNPKQPR